MSAEILASSPVPLPWDYQRVRSAWVCVEGCRLTLSDFLRFCSTGEADVCVPEIDRARDLFLQAGLDALAAKKREAETGWLQVGVSVPDSAAVPADLYARVASLARGLLGSAAIDGFFFMHKPPGLRLRFELAVQNGALVAGRLDDEIRAWQAEGLVERVVPGVYEPESRLFGGPMSMHYVHRLFTADSLAWLDYHASPRHGENERGARWQLSLAMLHALFAGLDITGWEDLDVWDRVRGTAGRRLTAVTTLAGFAQVAAQIRACWLQSDQNSAYLGPDEEKIVDAFRRAVLPVASDWRDGYFSTRSAYVGPRQAAAFATVFHWNRAGLSLTRQALLTEALIAREAH